APEVVVEVLDRLDPLNRFDPLEPAVPVPAHAPRVDGRSAELPAERGQFLSKHFASAAGARNFKLYVPSTYAGTPLPLVVMLHGCTQNPDDFALGTRANRWAEARGYLVAYPEQIQRANSHRCWNWFRSGDQHAGSGEPALIAGITQQVIAEYQIDARRVYVAGLSAGGAMAAVMGQAYPELFAAIGVHSGLPVGVAQDVSSALMLMKTGSSPLTHKLFARPPSAQSSSERAVPMIVVQGDADRTVNPVNATRLVEQAVAARQSTNSETTLRQSVQTVDANTAGHGYRRTQYADPSGVPVIEQWEIQGVGHAWSGGDAAGSYTDARGPDATRAMLEFFNRHLAPVAWAGAGVTDSAIPT
ncbi:MAG: PHB depolymerase family esterase, partial [Burkholderiaceae bacterium]|nr:PHB depolymerase family esterase [Burkholderiaceae bacterium]